MKLKEFNTIDDFELKKENIYDIISNIGIVCNQYKKYYDNDDDLISEVFIQRCINAVLEGAEQLKEFQE